MTPKSISLAKAMKLKNRLAGRLLKVQTTISTYNSVLEGRAGEVNIAELDKFRARLVEALIGLKTSLAEGSREIQRYIYELAEKKSEIVFLNTVQTRHGTEPAYGLNATPHVYVAAIKRQDVEDRVKKLETQIDELQDRVDSYNAFPNRIQIDPAVLELAS